MYYYCLFLFFTTPLRPRTREEKPINSKLKKWWKKGKKGADTLTYFPSKGDREEIYGKNNAQYD